ncbi:MAG TPA: ThuA domain-containing protein [Bacteroidales bacterium]|nr:ThuA domain-containing protein [Bacteroidales bacterium]HOK75354.1 ThuA domain-containing protein [Bacteroidales bacterium]HOM39279.1 ThuA domain-containing protein [Bacteroidales bacterium]HOU31473.1 ThuA domain-containing protein [Bacteroidales bacterium]HPP92919.1 ThuA domain-containing protein [Bacteroidales bacterium]
MKKIFFSFLVSFALLSTFAAKPPVKILVVTGGHGYNKETFNEMLNSLGSEFTYEVAELPDAFRMFLPENRNKYDVLLFYHMWQTITPEQKEAFVSCIKDGKPVVALHHSICAFDDWEEYWRIIGGKYFHKPTLLDGKEYPACSYIHDLHFNVKVADKKHPVTKGIKDFEIFDETYKGYWVDPSVKVLLTTDEPSSTPVIGWAKTYGKAKIVVLQSGHDTPTFQQAEFRQLLRQALEWVVK